MYPPWKTLEETLMFSEIYIKVSVKFGKGNYIYVGRSLYSFLYDILIMCILPKSERNEIRLYATRISELYLSTDIDYFIHDTCDIHTFYIYICASVRILVITMTS